MTADEAFKTLTENICLQCAYGAHCMDECDICSCDNRDALKALMSCCNEKWNVITKRPMDAEEREFWEVEMGEIADEDAYMYENLPEDGEEVLVCTQFGRVFIDTMCKDEGCYFEEYGEMDGIVAWMPLPKPYKEVGE